MNEPTLLDPRTVAEGTTALNAYFPLPGLGILFSADSFGAIMQEPAETAESINADALREGCITWPAIDAPWLDQVDMDKFGAHLSSIRDLGAKTILGSHLPPARGINDELISYLIDATRVPRFVGPDQAALEAMMAA